MDVVELNKMTQRKKVHAAEIRLYELLDLTKEESLVLVIHALKKEYGILKTTKIIHGLGVKGL